MDAFLGRNNCLYKRFRKFREFNDICSKKALAIYDELRFIFQTYLIATLISDSVLLNS